MPNSEKSLSVVTLHRRGELDSASHDHARADCEPGGTIVNAAGQPPRVVELIAALERTGT